MTPGDLISLMAHALKLRESTVSAHYRKLREAGLVTKKGRGRGSPESTANDAAALLLSILASDTAVSAAEAFRQFAGLRSRASTNGDIPDFNGMSLIEAITALLATKDFLSASGELRLVIAPRQRAAHILLGDRRLDFVVPEAGHESRTAERAVYESFGPLAGDEAGISDGLQTFASVAKAELRVLSAGLE